MTPTDDVEANPPARGLPVRSIRHYDDLSDQEQRELDERRERAPIASALFVKAIEAAHNADDPYRRAAYEILALRLAFLHDAGVEVKPDDEADARAFLAAAHVS